jgi:hypothetical protein
VSAKSVIGVPVFPHAVKFVIEIKAARIECTTLQFGDERSVRRIPDARSVRLTTRQKQFQDEMELGDEAVSLLDHPLLAAVRQRASTRLVCRLPERGDSEEDSTNDARNDTNDQKNYADRIYVDATCGRRNGPG